jgi:hypothetical protein
MSTVIYNSTMLWEMLVLAALARKLYKKPLPDQCFVDPPKITCCIDMPSNQENNNIITGTYNQCFDMNA